MDHCAHLLDGNALAALARARQGRLVTFDRERAALHGDVAELLVSATAPD